MISLTNVLYSILIHIFVKYSLGQTTIMMIEYKINKEINYHGLLFKLKLSSVYIILSHLCKLLLRRYFICESIINIRKRSFPSVIHKSLLVYIINRVMIFKKISFFNIINFNIPLIINLNKTKIFLLILFLASSLSISTSIYNFESANAATSLDQTIQQFQNNLQSNINNQIQSTLNNSLNSINKGNCVNGNNIVSQSNTNNNGQMSTTQTTCGTSNSFNPSSSSANIKGIIASSEFDLNTGVIVNSIFGNWSLTTNQNGINDFKSSFIKQPVFYNSVNNILSTPNTNTLATTSSPNTNTLATTSSNTISTNNQTGPTTPDQQNSTITSYNLSNFRANSINQQNIDITYQGKIDVVKEIKSLNGNIPDQTNIIKDVDISISILNGNILIINFDKQSILFNEFENIPLVGIVQ